MLSKKYLAIKIFCCGIIHTKQFLNSWQIKAAIILEIAERTSISYIPICLANKWPADQQSGFSLMRLNQQLIGETSGTNINLNSCFVDVIDWPVFVCVSLASVHF